MGNSGNIFFRFSYFLPITYKKYALRFLLLRDVTQAPSAMILINASKTKTIVKKKSMPSKVSFLIESGGPRGSSNISMNELASTEKFMNCVKIVLLEHEYHF